MTESRRSWRQESLRGGGTEVTTYDMLQAAGLSGSDPCAATRAVYDDLSHPSVTYVGTQYAYHPAGSRQTRTRSCGYGLLKDTWGSLVVNPSFYSRQTTFAFESRTPDST